MKASNIILLVLFRVIAVQRAPLIVRQSILDHDSLSARYGLMATTKDIFKDAYKDVYDGRKVLILRCLLYVNLVVPVTIGFRGKY